MSGTASLFRTYRIAGSRFQGSTTGAFTDVPARYAFMFQKYSVAEWNSFNEHAARIMASSETEARISTADYNALEGLSRASESQPAPRNEDQLVVGWNFNVMVPLNIIRGRRDFWETFPPADSGPVDQESNRKLDFALMDMTSSSQGSSSSHRKGSSSKAPKGSSSKAPKGSSSKAPKGSSNKEIDEDLKLEMVIAGEMKRPNLYLGSDLTAGKLHTLIRKEDCADNNAAFPYFQLFSYMIRSRKGLGILSNGKDTRFFKMDPANELIRMSPVVRREQLLSTSSRTPHPLQAHLYLEELDDALVDKGVRKHLEVQLKKGRDKADEWERQKKKKAEKDAREAEKKAAGSSSDHKKSKDKDKSSGKHGKHKEASYVPVISPATLVLDKCEVIGILGEGLCGLVKECDYEGLKVALKVGLPFKPRCDEEDCFTLVKNEIEVFEKLEGLQGKVIPRMVVGGFERFYNPAAMVIITEKVGMGVDICEDRMFVGEKELSREDLIAMREKGLEGLKKMHECGVVHMDTAVRNTRVDMKDGKVDKVWWIDLGVARMIDYETEQAIDKTGYNFDIHYMTTIDKDISRYTSIINEVLDKMQLA